MSRKCALCERESWTDGNAQPAMCEQHFDLALLAGHVLRSSAVVNIEGLERAYALLPAEVKLKLSFGKAEIAGLYAQAVENGFDLAYHNGGARVAIGEMKHDHSD